MMRLRRRSTPARAPATPPPVESRPRLHHDLEALEHQMRDMADCAERALALSVEALADSDIALAASVIATDDDIDRRYEEIERRAIDLMGRQQPVASDLRLLVALIHVALHLERIGDMAVNVAEATRSAASLPAMPGVLGRLQDMGHTAASMTEMAVDAFTRRDRHLCERLPELDDRVDQLDREMASHVMA
ncbi:MAG TPA: PhoU domain-containing protein [Acidimicrobiales bacterium]|nr:PhoU domain-containing protein [Acidimicrobiales bacterium]